MIGDIDPIKAARGGQDIADELTVHYGLLPRANRGIFAINELPDLAGKIQVGLFNIMQEGDVQIKGYPVRLPLDVMLVFTANPGRLHRARQDHHAAQRPHRQRDPHPLSHARSSTASRSRGRNPGPSVPRPSNSSCPAYIREIVEQLAFLAREDKRVDKRSGVSQRLPISVLENVVSNAERRALARSRRRCRAARARHLRRAALHHRQARTRVRRRAEGRRHRGARTDPHRRRQGLQLLLRRRQRLATSSSGSIWAAR